MKRIITGYLDLGVRPGKQLINKANILPKASKDRNTANISVLQNRTQGFLLANR